MGAFLFRCPVTGQNVQGWIADDPTADTDENVYEAVSCLACNRSHLVNRSTRRVLGAED